MEAYIIFIIVIVVMLAFGLCIFCWKKSKCLGGGSSSENFVTKSKISEKYEYSSSTGTLPSSMPLPSSLTITNEKSTTAPEIGFQPIKTTPHSESYMTETRSYTTSAAPNNPNAGNTPYSVTTETETSYANTAARRSPTAYPGPVPQESPAAQRYYRIINKQISKESLYDNVVRPSPLP